MDRDEGLDHGVEQVLDGEAQGDKDDMVGTDMVYMENMGNILDMDYMGEPRMGRTMGRTKHCPKDSM